MVRLAVAEEEGFEPSDIEIGREGIIYTVDTLALLRAQMPKADFFYIIGEDTLYELPHWRNPDKVFSMCRFLVIRRQGEVEKSEAQVAQEALIARGAQFAFLSMEAQPTSSTEIRLQFMLGASPKELHPAVAEYIRVMGLYGVSQSPQGAARHMDKLMQSLSIKRMAHTLCVAQTARQLAILHGAEVEKATLAGLYHDCAKGIPLVRMQEIAKANHLTDDLLTLQSGALLHSLVGGYLTKEEYGVSDPEVLAAIVCHTLGRTGMTKLDMIVYLADKIEPSRTSYPELEEIRSLALADLPGAVLKSMESTVTYVKSRERHCIRRR